MIFYFCLFFSTGSTRTKLGEVMEGGQGKAGMRTSLDTHTHTHLKRKNQPIKHKNKNKISKSGSKQGKVGQNLSLGQVHVLTLSTESSTDINV